MARKDIVGGGDLGHGGVEIVNFRVMFQIGSGEGRE